MDEREQVLRIEAKLGCHICRWANSTMWLYGTNGQITEWKICL